MGDSAAPPEGPDRYTFVDHRRYLDALLDGLGVREPVTLVVHDWGSAPDQAEVAVPGLHFLQEDSPEEIGRAVARWLGAIADLPRRRLSCRRVGPQPVAAHPLISAQLGASLWWACGVSVYLPRVR